MPTVSGNVGAVGPPAGSYVPVADTTGVTVDTTTYPDPIKGGAAKLTTLIFPDSQGGIAMAISGDAFPRWLMDADATGGLYVSDGTYDPFVAGCSLYAFGSGIGISAGPPKGVFINQMFAANSVDRPPRMDQVSPRFTVTSGALPTVQLVSGAGAQVLTTRDVDTYTPLTLTTAGGTVVVALSPDNTTYSTVMTVTPAVNASVTDVTVRVPAGWYLKMTATNATLGLTTYA